MVLGSGGVMPINEFTFDDAFPGWTLRYFSSETNLQLHPSAEFWVSVIFLLHQLQYVSTCFNPCCGWLVLAVEVCEGALMQEEFQMKPFDWFPEPKLSAFGSYIQAQRGSHWEKGSNLTPFGYIVYTSSYTKPKPLAKVLNLNIHQLIIWLVDIILRLGFYQKTLPLPQAPSSHRAARARRWRARIWMCGCLCSSTWSNMTGKLKMWRCRWL